jgi:hypothetical protein
VSLGDLDLLARVVLDLVEVGVFEKRGKDRDEPFALIRAQRSPGPAHRQTRHLIEVEVRGAQFAQFHLLVRLSHLFVVDGTQHLRHQLLDQGERSNAAGCGERLSHEGDDGKCDRQRNGELRMQAA